MTRHQTFSGKIMPLSLSLIGFKCVYWIILLIALETNGNFDRFTIMYWPEDINQTIASHLVPYDGCFYLYISHHGYEADSRECAFYPLWPLILRGGLLVTGSGSPVVGLILSNLLAVIAWLLFFQYVSYRWCQEIATWSLIFLILFPGSLFYQFLYSESLFLLLLVGLLWGLERGDYMLTFLMAFLLPLTRPIGVFCTFPMLLEILAVAPSGRLEGRLKTLQLWLQKNPVSDNQIESRERQLSHMKRKSGLWNKRLSVWWLILSPFWGWLLYFVIMLAWTGDPLSGFKAQKYWGVNSIGNLLNLSKFVISWFSPLTWHAYKGSLLDRCVFTIVVYCAPLLWRLDKTYMAWLYVLAVMPAMSATFTSCTRYTSVAFPFFIALALLFRSKERRLLRYILLSIFGVAQIALVWRYVNFKWAG